MFQKNGSSLNRPNKSRNSFDAETRTHLQKMIAASAILSQWLFLGRLLFLQMSLDTCQKTSVQPVTVSLKLSSEHLGVCFHPVLCDKTKKDLCQQCSFLFFVKTSPMTEYFSDRTFSRNLQCRQKTTKWMLNDVKNSVPIFVSIHPKRGKTAFISTAVENTQIAKWKHVFIVNRNTRFHIYGSRDGATRLDVK